MSFFGIGDKSERYGVIIDIGSGSVLVAVVHSDLNKKYPKIVWSHREQAPLRNIDSLEQSSKSVLTALINAAMLLDSVGRKALQEYDEGARFTEIKCTVSAPWSYTVTKKITYAQEESFVITDSLLEELVETVQNKIENDIKENESLLNIGLQVISHGVRDVSANGYRVSDPVGSQSKTLNISRSSVMSHRYLVDAIDEMHSKLFQSTELHKLSFMLVFFEMTQLFFGEMRDVCLIDVTYEATEIGIVRNGVLAYCTHTPFGSFSLAREIAEVTKVPLVEAFGYLHTNTPYSFTKTLSKGKRNDIDAIFESYVNKLNQLFHETGDDLAIPKHISLNVDAKSESLFIDLIERAVKRTIKTEPKIVLVSDEIRQQVKKNDSDGDGINGLEISDTALLLAAQFFHTKENHRSFKYL